MEYFLPFLLFCIVGTITPGPNNIMLLSSGVNFGIRRSMPHLTGIFVGFPLVTLSVGLGFASLFEAFPIMQQILKIISIAYLLYLAWRIAMTRSDVQGNSTAKPMSFLQAASFQWVNPKTWIMSVGAIATYTSADGNFLLEIVLICLIFSLTFIPCGGLWLIAGVWLKKYLQQPKLQQYFNFSMAALLVASIFIVVLD